VGSIKRCEILEQLHSLGLPKKGSGPGSQFKLESSAKLDRIDLSCSHSVEHELSASHTPTVIYWLGASCCTRNYVSLKHVSITSVFVGSEARISVTRGVLFSGM
jgi:hypothetical protein